VHSADLGKDAILRKSAKQKYFLPSTSRLVGSWLMMGSRRFKMAEFDSPFQLLSFELLNGCAMCCCYVWFEISMEASDGEWKR